MPRVADGSWTKWKFIHALIVDSLKQNVRTFLEWFGVHHPYDGLYGILLDVPAEGDAVNLLAATDNALERAVAKAINRGKPDAAVRDETRWSSPGESGDPWCWPEYELARATSYLVGLAIERGLIRRFGTTVRELSAQALADLEREGTFGSGAGRERVFVGVFDVHEDFVKCLDRSARCNPASVVARVRGELVRAEGGGR